MKKLIMLVCMVMLVGCAAHNSGEWNGVALTDRTLVVEAIGVDAPPVVVKAAPEAIIKEIKVAGIYESIMFPYDSTEITMDEQAKLVKIADMLNEYPDTIVVIEGFASKEGTDEYNLALSQDRADVVQTELIQMGIAGDRIKSVDGKGETEDFDFSSFAPNRRVLVITVN
jgi:outer membrane protein OmpA-like peptidoglycan-associated protein